MLFAQITIMQSVTIHYFYVTELGIMGSHARTDIQRVVEEWAKDYFERKANRSEKKIIAKDYLAVEVDWKRVKFIDEEPVYDPHPPKVGAGTPKHNILFHTTFSNKTDKVQKYHFETVRTTKSSCTVEIEKGYTKGVEMSVTLKTPGEILEANAGFHRELSLTNIEGETLEEELSWGVNSEMSVPPGMRAQAKLVIKEEEYKGTFSMQTTILGRVRVVFLNLKDNNSFLKAAEADLYQIIQWGMAEKIVLADNIKVDQKEKSVICSTKGKCHFTYGIKQDVEVEQFPLDDDSLNGV